jgi:hypothetical protein
MNNVATRPVESSKGRFTRLINAQRLRRKIIFGQPLLQFEIRQFLADHRTQRNYQGYGTPQLRAGSFAALPDHPDRPAQPRQRRGGMRRDYRRASVQRMSITVSDATDLAKRRQCGS